MQSLHSTEQRKFKHRWSWINQIDQRLSRALISHIIHASLYMLLCVLYVFSTLNKPLDKSAILLIAPSPWQSRLTKNIRNLHVLLINFWWSSRDFGSIKRCDWATRIAHAWSRRTWLRGVEHLSPVTRYKCHANYCLEEHGRKRRYKDSYLWRDLAGSMKAMGSTENFIRLTDRFCRPSAVSDIPRKRAAREPLVPREAPVHL